jgi:hypothetical protein
MPSPIFLNLIEGRHPMNFLFIALTVVLISNAAIAGGPSMTMGTENTELSQEDCMTKAASATRDVGFTQNFDKEAKTVYGEKGTYTSAIRCETAVKFAIFVVAGPDSDKTESSYDKLRASFTSP